MWLPFHTVAAALRLGSKYAIHALRDEALRRLRKCYVAKIRLRLSALTKISGVIMRTYAIIRNYMAMGGG